MRNSRLQKNKQKKRKQFIHTYQVLNVVKTAIKIAENIMEYELEIIVIEKVKILPPERNFANLCSESDALSVDRSSSSPSDEENGERRKC